MSSPKLPAFCALAFLAVSPFAYAQEFQVTYLDGTAEVKTDQSWRELMIGDMLTGSSLLRLGPHSFIELAGPQTISISEPGNYALSQLTAAAHALRQSGGESALVGTLSRLFGPGPPPVATVMGVRGIRRGEDQDREKALEEAVARVETGRGMLESGKYESAVTEFQAAIETAGTVPYPEARYYLTWALSLAGRTREALAESESLTGPTRSKWWPDFALLRAKLLVDTSAFGRAVDWLSAQSDRLSQDAEHAAALHFLLGLSYGALGDAGKAQEHLQAVIDAGDPSLTAAAQKLLAQ